jgi:tetratricopeptide (TPR) repeat protein
MSDAAIRRNDPCPCGSGRKFKQCCLGAGEAGASSGTGGPARPGSGPAATAPAAARGVPPRATAVAEARRHAAGGEWPRAEAIWRSLLDRDARDVEAARGLAEARLARGAAGEAAAVLAQAAALRPADASLRLAQADACLRAGLGGDARNAAEAAVAIAPRDPAAGAMLAMVLERTNDLDAAAAAVDAVSSVAPDHVSVITMAARIARRRGHADAAIERLEPLLKRRDLSPFQRQVALHEYAMALEAAGRHAEAWTAFRETGRAVAEDPAARRLDRQAWPRRIEACRRGLSRALLDRAGPRVSPPPPLEFRPVFLVGFPRSGTTMTETVLAAHPAVRTTDEQPFLGAIKRTLATAVAGPPDDLPALLARLTPPLRARLRTEYAGRVTAAMGPMQSGTVLVDKLPLNIVDIALADVLFPEARVLLALRDPRDVCLSCFQQWFELNTAMVHFLDPQDTVRFYAQVMGGWLDARPHLRLPVLAVRYEDTTADLEGQARRMLEFLELPWDPGVLAGHERVAGRAVSTPSYAAISEPVHRRAVARWRRYADALAGWEEPLGPFLEAFGYEPG